MKNLCTLLFAAFVAVANAQTYTVITYNIRYKNKHDGDDKWDNRKAKVAAIITDNKADIVGLQEAKEPQVNYLNRQLKGYAYVGVGRDNGKTKGEYSPIFYKQDKFSLIDKGWFWLSENPAKPGKGWDAACPRICTWVVLRDTVTKKQIAAFNTHLDHKGAAARQNGVKLILDSLGKKLEKYGIQPDTVSYMPGYGLLMGDFNFTPDNANYERVANDGNFALTPRYDSYVVATSKPLGTVGTTNAFKLDGVYNSRIDYVWVTRGFSVESYQTINDKLPNGHWPSDHFPVMVKLYLPN